MPLDHAELYARLGQLLSKALYEHLASLRTLPAPGNQLLRLSMIQEPYIYHGNWAFTFDIELPNAEGNVTFMLAQAGSGFDPDKVTLALPPKDFEDDSLKEYPPEHQKTYNELLDLVSAEITKRGFTDSLEGDFVINQDYYPSSNVSVGVMNPAIITKDLVYACQALLKNRPFAFSISFSLVPDDPHYKGKNEVVIVREDRIAEDWNLERLRSEYGGRLAW